MPDLAAATAIATTHTQRRDELVVVEREDVADSVIALTLERPDGADLPAWTPGAHIDVYVDPATVRQYSLCGLPGDRRQWRIGVLREAAGRGGSEQIHKDLQLGSRVAVRGPRNHFLLAEAQRYVFIAGGIGITPLMPMIAEVAAAGLPWQLQYGGRSRSTMAFAEQLVAAYGDGVTLWPEDECGLLDLPRLLGSPEPGRVVYCCGPEGLLVATESNCASWPSGSLHIERFSAKPGQLADEPGDKSFEVICTLSDLTVTVPPGKSIIDVLETNGVSVLCSCQEGVCGTCETKVLGGIPEHRDSLLTDEERATNEYMMICVGRARSGPLTLEI